MHSPYVPHYLNETLDIGWLGSCTGNHTAENVRIVTVLLQKIIVIAKEGGYSGLFLVTSNQLLRVINFLQKYKISLWIF